jgi:RND family efflux transporter MFP subunit
VGTPAPRYSWKIDKLMALWKNLAGIAVVTVTLVVTDWVVHRFHVPGHLDVVAAQAMDMSEMRPPTGAAPVALAMVRKGSLADTVTYTGSVVAYNEQDISPRITGDLVSLLVYSGDTVKVGQLVAQLDVSQVGPQATQAAAQARAAEIAEHVASDVQVQSQEAGRLQAQAQLEVTRQEVPDVQAQAQAAQDGVRDAQAGVQSAQASANYWKTEIVREKQLADAGAVSEQEYQNELAQSQAAEAAVTQALAKVTQAQAMTRSAQVKVVQARQQVTASAAAARVASEDVAVAQGQAAQAQAQAASAQASAASAAAQQGYARITSPADGLVTSRPVAPGTLVQPGTVILKIAEIARVRVQANVAVEDMAGIHVGSPVQIMVEGGQSPAIHAHVTSVFPSADPQTRTAVVEAVISNPGDRLLPGAFVTMHITKGNITDRLLVPADALLYQGGQGYVWVAGGTENASAQEIAVQPGASDGTWTEVTSPDLSAGERVVVHGQAGLVDGAHMVATAWGPNGPQSLPSATVANAGQTLYRCEKCGMTYSATDAKKDHYTDPMDGGTLVPVKTPTQNSAPMTGMKM